MCSTFFVHWTWRWLALTPNVEGSPVSGSVHELPSVRRQQHSRSGTTEMGRKTQGPQLGVPGVRKSYLSILAHGEREYEPVTIMSQCGRMHFSPPHCPASHMVWLRRNESTAVGITATHPSRWYVGECELNLDSRAYHSQSCVTVISVIRGERQRQREREKNRQLHWRRSNGSIWSCLLCGSVYPPTAGSKAVCAASLWHRESLWYSRALSARERGADAKVLLSKSVGTVSFNR